MASETSRSVRVTDNQYVRSVVGGFKKIVDDRMTLGYFLFLVFVLFLGVFGPLLTPYQYNQAITGPGGQILTLAPPSLAHPLGTTFRGYDVLSRVLYGARPTVIVGLLGGSMVIGIGLAVGITAGYVGGRTETVLMRITDFVYGVPIIPFAIVGLAFFGVGFISSIIVIGLLLWRSSARVIRAQVLQTKELPYIKAVQASGASTPRIIFTHILPNVAPMATFFFAWGVGYSILIQASLAFLGVTNPFVPGWGIMLRNAYNSGYLSVAWWWSIPPGLLISFTVLSTFMFGRGFESEGERSGEDEGARIAG